VPTGTHPLFAFPGSRSCVGGGPSPVAGDRYSVSAHRHMAPPSVAVAPTAGTWEARTSDGTVGRIAGDLDPRQRTEGQTSERKMISPVATGVPSAGSTVIAHAVGAAGASSVTCTSPSSAGSSTYIAIESSGVINHSS